MPELEGCVGKWVKANGQVPWTEAAADGCAGLGWMALCGQTAVSPETEVTVLSPAALDPLTRSSFTQPLTLGHSLKATPPSF